MISAEKILKDPYRLGERFRLSRGQDALYMQVPFFDITGKLLPQQLGLTDTV